MEAMNDAERAALRRICEWFPRPSDEELARLPIDKSWNKNLWLVLDWVRRTSAHPGTSEEGK